MLPCEHSGHTVNGSIARLAVNSVTKQAEAQIAPKCQLATETEICFKHTQKAMTGFL